MSYENKKAAIDAIKSQVATFGELSVEQKRKINYKFRLEWNYNSNSMEGNTLTIEETRSVMVGNLTVNDKPLKDIFEMQGHDKVITEILKIGKGELRLSEKRIKEIHSGIMHEENPKSKNKIGQWKEKANEIINSKGEKYSFVAPEEVPDKIHALLNKTNAAIDAINANKKNAPHPIDVAMDFHLEYLDIHPFYDGNGRTARILTNLILISLGYNPFWINEKDRSIYYNYISDIQGYGGSRELFFEYCAGLIERSEQLVLNAIQDIDIEEEDDLHKEISLLKRQLEGESFTKSPKNIYEIFQFINSDVWNPLAVVINQFDDLFSEGKTKHSVNHQNEKFPTKSILSSFVNPFEKSTEPTEIKIFGHNVYETDIYEIEWHHTKYGLKKAQNNNIYEIIFSLSFEATNYNIRLYVNHSEVWESNYAYNEFPHKETIEQVKKDLGKNLIERIRNDIK
ncbi:Fic family protein [Flavobacterium hibisci]|uniref:Fic family protein n=1 Tax=Flavobacterium hibisci TaxID=1914462 RepID=UPI001CBAE80E|nr:Fic family protein [Flavobacterium hibisci]MBZ4044226.1 Fic family protein [Flavobacterium hibisci]